MWSLLLITATMLLKYNPQYATHIHRTTLVSFLFSSIVVLFALGFSSFSQNEFSTAPAYSNKLKPLSHFIFSADNVDEFIQGYEAQFQKLLTRR